MQVLSSNPLRTREDLARAAADIIRPTLACLTPGKARMIPGYGSAHYSEDVAGMEGFSRVLWALVPLLAGWCGLDQRKAFATSVAVILPLCILSAAVYLFRGGVELVPALPYLAGGLAGGLLGGRVFRRMNMTWLRRGFALLILYGGARALFFS